MHHGPDAPDGLTGLICEPLAFSPGDPEAGNEAGVVVLLATGDWPARLQALAASMPAGDPLPVVLVTEDRRLELFAARLAGVGAFVDREDPVWELLGAVRSAAAGRHYASRSLHAALAASFGEPELDLVAPPAARRAGQGLTGREREIGALAVGGLGNEAIAAQLHVTPGTVKFHLRGVYRKLGIKTRADLVRCWQWAAALLAPARGAEGEGVPGGPGREAR